jgi:hypothetical protein
MILVIHHLFNENWFTCSLISPIIVLLLDSYLGWDGQIIFRGVGRLIKDIIVFHFDLVYRIINTNKKQGRKKWNNTIT